MINHNFVNRLCLSSFRLTNLNLSIFYLKKKLQSSSNVNVKSFIYYFKKNLKKINNSINLIIQK